MVKKGLAEKPHSGLLGTVIVWWVQQQEGRSTPEGHGGKRDQKASWGQIPLGLVGFYFTFDGKSLKCFEQMGGVT